MRRALEMPFDGAVVRIERQTRGREQVVARAQVRVPRRRVAGTEEQLIGFRVVVAAQPRRRATGFPKIAGPGLARLAAGNAGFNGLAVFVDITHMTFHGRSGPEQVTVLRIVSLDFADHAELAAGDPGNQFAIDHQRCGTD